MTRTTTWTGFISRQQDKAHRKHGGPLIDARLPDRRLATIASEECVDLWRYVRQIGSTGLLDGVVRAGRDVTYECAGVLDPFLGFGWWTRTILDRAKYGRAKYGVDIADAGLSVAALAEHALEEAADLHLALMALATANAGHDVYAAALVSWADEVRELAEGLLLPLLTQDAP